MLVVKASSEGHHFSPCNGQEFDLYLCQHCYLHIKMDTKVGAVYGMCYSCLYKVLHSPYGDEILYIYICEWVQNHTMYCSNSIVRLQIKVEVTHTIHYYINLVFAVLTLFPLENLLYKYYQPPIWFCPGNLWNTLYQDTIMTSHMHIFCICTKGPNEQACANIYTDRCNYLHHELIMLCFYCNFPLIIC